MPAFPDLTESERIALAEVVRQFADLQAYGTPFEIPEPSVSPDIARGIALFSELQCASYHGEAGDGNGILADPSNLAVGTRLVIPNN